MTYFGLYESTAALYAHNSDTLYDCGRIYETIYLFSNMCIPNLIVDVEYVIIAFFFFFNCKSYFTFFSKAIAFLDGKSPYIVRVQHSILLQPNLKILGSRMRFSWHTGIFQYCFFSHSPSSPCRRRPLDSLSILGLDLPFKIVIYWFTYRFC